MNINGKECRPYNGAFNPDPQEGRYWGRPVVKKIPHRKNKVTTLDEVMDVIRDGDTISYPHYYRLGDNGLKMVVDKLRETGKRNIIIYGNAFFDHTDPWLAEAIRDGVIRGFYGNPYRKLGAYVTSGNFLPWTSTGFSHGNRVRKLQTGEIKVKVAFGPVPIADIYGNANGLLGKEDEKCGPVGLFDADALYADYTCLLAGTVSEILIMPTPLSMETVDFVVPVDGPGKNTGIGSGTLDVGKAKANPFNAQVADNVRQRRVVVPGIDVWADETGRSRVNHFHDAQRIGDYTVCRVAFRKIRLHNVVKKRHPVHVIAEAAQQGLIGMRMRIDQSGNRNHACPVKQVRVRVTLANIFCRVDSSYFLPVNGNTGRPFEQVV